MKNYVYGINTSRNALMHNQTIKNIYLLNGFKNPQIYKLIKEKEF